MTWLRIFAVILLITVLVFSVTEIFDTWDNTAQTGNDIDFNTMLVALCLGAVLASIRFVAVLLTPIRFVGASCAGPLPFRPAPPFSRFIAQASPGSLRI